MRHSRNVWPDEDELVHLTREAQGGRPGALDALLATLRPSFVAYFAPAIGRDDAEDAAQLALLSILQALPGIDADGALGYVVAVARYRLGKARRRAPPRGARVAPLTRCPRGRRDALRASPVSLITTRNLLASVWSSVWDTSLPSRVTRLG